ncbi:hypothetical protein DIPPA_08273 [Diplonema papillatum]|nr:hypothetical protein DIPPA_08273 [Diplonema papillatum]
MASDPRKTHGSIRRTGAVWQPPETWASLLKRPLPAGMLNELSSIHNIINNGASRHESCSVAAAATPKDAGATAYAGDSAKNKGSRAAGSMPEHIVKILKQPALYGGAPPVKSSPLHCRTPAQEQLVRKANAACDCADNTVLRASVRHTEMHAIRAVADLPRNQISRLRISEGIRGPPPHANQCDLTPCEKRSCEFVYGNGSVIRRNASVATPSAQQQ